MGFIDRSLPHYPRFENGVESRGFVASNFIDGLHPHEFFFHAMSGREGLIDTAVKTANSGYLQRKLVKATEDLKVNHDYTVRSSNNKIVEFIYGEDGFYPSFLEQQKTRLINNTNDDINKKYIIDVNDSFEDNIMKKSVTKMKASKNGRKLLKNIIRWFMSQLIYYILTSPSFIKKFQTLLCTIQLTLGLYWNLPKKCSS